MSLHPIAIIGYGEVGRILAEDLRAAGQTVTAFDLKLNTAAAPALQAHARQHGVVLTIDHGSAVRSAELVVSAVTASQDITVAQACAGALKPGSFFLDFNSASPGAKGKAAAIVKASGARYVEGAVMTSLPPYRIKVPLLLGGPDAADLLAPLKALGFNATLASSELGKASATKMCRSVMIKGLEAMVIESFTAARAYCVEKEVIASLLETFPGVDWEAQAAYFFQRVIEHGRRRSEEVFEVAETVRDMGLAPLSSTGTAQRQAWVADLADQGVFGARGEPGFARNADWRVEADRILAHLKR